ncbi:DnrO protein [Pseudomonas stutzeri]|uniref:DnrO protein n=1 Tax=Stutzerimonas stutzeri TaxID=316 RepID=A0A2N8S521_STUST|nr:DnrO protein [Stutzerimonas stutzeri]MCQ4296799.1 DnrO protein [Stutzerimonas stutzeri]PNF81726.1 DnrO protein [Stutzerimonas stutzeri]
MKQYLQPVAWGLAMVSIVALASNFALSMVINTAQAATAHDHSQHAQPVVATKATHGERWSTDVALREGMTRIHEAVQRSMPDNPGQPVSDESAASLQRDIEAATSYLIANCELPEAADNALHGLLIDLLKGAEALSEPEQRESGLQRVLDTLERYPQLFAEPVWRDGFIAHLH